MVALIFREAGLSWDEDRINSISKKVFTDLRAVPSSYSVDITVGEGYTPNSPRLKAVMGVVVESLKLLKERNLSRATLYYAHPDGKLLNPGADAGQMFSGAQARYQEIVDRADFIGRFRNLGKERTRTAATLSRKLKNPPDLLTPMNIANLATVIAQGDFSAALRAALLDRERQTSNLQHTSEKARLSVCHIRTRTPSAAPDVH
jgi:hypothetical protein